MGWRNMIRLLLLLGWIPLMFWGCQESYVWVSNWNPTKMSMQQFAAASDKPLWVELGDAEVNYTDTGCLTEGSEKRCTDEYFVPVRAPNLSDTAPISVVMKIADPANLTMVRELLAAAKKPTEEDPLWALKVLSKYDGKLKVQGTVRGLVRFGLSDDSSTLSAIKRNWPTSKAVVVLEQNAKPSIGFGLLKLFGGLGWGLLVWMFAVSWASESDTSDAKT